jgi:hypothetical protein
VFAFQLARFARRDFRSLNYNRHLTSAPFRLWPHTVEWKFIDISEEYIFSIFVYLEGVSALLRNLCKFLLDYAALTSLYIIKFTVTAATNSNPIRLELTFWNARSNPNIVYIFYHVPKSSARNFNNMITWPNLGLWYDSRLEHLDENARCCEVCDTSWNTEYIRSRQFKGSYYSTDVIHRCYELLSL